MTESEGFKGMTMKKRLYVAVVWFLICCLPGIASPKLDVMLDFFVNPNHIPLIVAVKNGFFAQEGIEVKILVPGNPSDPIKLVAAGAMDIALTPQINLLIARDAGLPVVAIGSLIGSPLGGLLALKGNGISNLSDLRGHRIGYSLAPLEPILWRTMLASVGVKPGEYELINVGFNTVLSLLSGQVDAIGAFRNFEVPQVTIAGHGPVFFPEEKYGVPHTEEIIIAANANTVGQDAVKMRAFLAGLARGIAFTEAHPEEAFQEFVAAYPDLNDTLNRRAYEITLPLFSSGARLGPAQEWQNLQSYLFKNNLIKSEFKLTALYTEAYLPAKKENK
ncbi:MAG TPA: ABC transporter substrate-binding protein [Candidatus Acetothermia bacterium]|nr:ABC transporter substrate-binding protein [Candidatus Acetothermia bacterium]